MNASDLTYNLGGVWRNGRGSAPCPVCQPERRRDQNALSISEHDGRLLLFCFKNRCDFRTIAETANVRASSARIDPVAQREVEAKRKEYEEHKLGQARGLWEAAVPISGTKAEKYLRARAITCEMPQSLRFVPDIHHTPSMTWCSAMIAKVEPTDGVHRTFLSKKGQRVTKTPKMMLGPTSGGAVRLSEAIGPLILCEGIETGLSLMSGLLDGPAAVWAALSTSGMKSVRLPHRPGELVVAMDGDDAGREAGHKLAERANALGWHVSTMCAPSGKDFNDVLQEGGAI